MEHEKFYSKQALAFELGISLKTMGQRIKNHEDEDLKDLYKEKRLFSPAERMYILKLLLYQVNLNHRKWYFPVNSSYFQLILLNLYYKIQNIKLDKYIC